MNKRACACINSKESSALGIYAEKKTLQSQASKKNKAKAKR